MPVYPTIVLRVVVFVTDPTVKPTASFGRNKLVCGSGVGIAIQGTIDVPFPKVGGVITGAFKGVCDGGYILREGIVVARNAVMWIYAGE